MLVSTLGESFGLVVDLRASAPRQRAPAMLGYCQALAPGDGFTLVDDRDPAGLLFLLLHHNPGEFEWSPLVKLRSYWRVLVTRRLRRALEPRRVLQVMTTDHLRMGQLMNLIRELAGEQQWTEAARVCTYLDTMIDRHTCMEQEVLFPLLAPDDDEHPCCHAEILEREHHQLDGLVCRMLDVSMAASQRWAPSHAAQRELDRVAAELQRRMRQHVVKEEALLYAAVDRKLGPDGGQRVERDLLATSARTLPEWSWAAGLFVA